MRLFNYVSTLLLLLFGLIALQAQPTYFKVKIENVGQVYSFSQSGAFTTPLGGTEPAPAFPGDAYEFSFDAAPGSYLTFATMFVQSNDLFYAPDEMGIALYDDMGNPVQGDLTDQLLLWDAGTEANQAPGEGADQAPSQSGPDVGADDPDNTVRLVNDGYTYPPAMEVIQFTLTHNGGTSFTARIENVSTSTTLTLSDGSTVAVPLSPGVFVVHTAPAPLFTAGEADRGEGLEGIAEDGSPVQLHESVDGDTGATAVLSPGAFVVHGSNAPLFSAGEMDRGEGLEAIAEDGMPGMLAATLRDAETVTGGVFAVPVGASGPGPILPGGAYEFVVASGPSGKLSFATMYVQSNDLFYAPATTGIALFDQDGMPIEGDITDQVDLWDAGTELNEVPGVGLNQAPRQSGPDTGEADPDNTVRLVNDGFTYPADESVIRVTISTLETTQFTVRIENLSDANTLPIDDMNAVPVPLSPGVWALHSSSAPLFAVGEIDRGFGLEDIAEDGDPMMLNTSLAGKMGTPSGAFTTPVGGSEPAPAFPGEAYEFTVVAAPGMNLSLATMFVQSNDLFYAPGEMGIPLFDEDGNPVSGDVTEYFDLWDVGTELNEQPGVGPNQAPRQSGPDMGDMDSDNTVRLVNDQYTYPADEEVIKVTINPQVEPQFARLQVIHAAISQTVEVRVNGETLLPAFAYRTATPFIDVPAETPLTIELIPVGGPTPADQIATIEVELAAEQTYVAAAHGTFDPSDDIPVGLSLHSPAWESAEDGSIGLSFFSGAIDVATLDVMQNGDVLFGDITYGSFADYQAFPASDFELDLVSDGDLLGTYAGSFGFWNRKSAVIFTTESQADGDFQPWVALSNGGTYPLFPLNNLIEEEVQAVVVAPNSNTGSTIQIAEVFPNPSHGQTTLQYTLEKEARVSIQLRDLNGRVVRSVFEGRSDVGVHRLNEDLSNLPKGLYFYSVVMDDQVQTLRLVVQ